MPELSEPRILSSILETALVNRTLSPDLLARVEAQTVVQRGDLREILALGNSLPLKTWIEENGINGIENYDQLKQKLDALVDEVEALVPAQAYVFVKHWLQQARLSADVQTLAHAFMRISSVMDKRGLTKLDEAVLKDKSFDGELGQSIYDRSIRLPWSGDRPELAEKEQIDSYFLALKQSEGRKGEVLSVVDYKGALIVRLLAESLAERTKGHIGADRCSGLPIVWDDKAQSYKEALRFARVLPVPINTWEDRGLRDIYVADHNHLAFLQDSQKMRDIVNVVLPDGDRNPLFLAYESALLEQSTGLESSLEDVVHTCLSALQKELLVHIKAAFGQCREPLHPRIEVAARNIAWFSLTTGEGSKTSPYASMMINSAVDQASPQVPPLSGSVSILQEIAIGEGLDLTRPMKEIAARLIADQYTQPTSLRGLVDKIMIAYHALKKSEDPLANSSGEEKWYVATVLFSTSEQKGISDMGEDGHTRRYGAILELIQFIRDFDAAKHKQ